MEAEAAQAVDVELSAGEETVRRLLERAHSRAYGWFCLSMTF